MKKTLGRSFFVLLAIAFPGTAFGQIGIGTGGIGTGGFGGTGGIGGIGTGGFGATGGIGGQQTGGLPGSTGLGTGAATTSTQPYSPFGGTTTPQNIFGGFNYPPQGFSTTLSQQQTNRTGVGGVGGAGGLGGLGGVGGLGGLGGLGGRGLGGIGGLGGLGARGMQTQQGRNGANANTKVRAVVTLGFDRPEVPASGPDSTVAKAQTHLANTVLPDRLKNVQIAMEGRTAVLRGQAANESEKKLVERLLSLEPGIDTIKNEITVSPGSGEVIQPRSR